MVIRGVMLKYKPVLSLPKGSMVGKGLYALHFDWAQCDTLLVPSVRYYVRLLTGRTEHF